MEESPNETYELRPVTEKFDNLEISEIKTSLTRQNPTGNGNTNSFEKNRENKVFADHLETTSLASVNFNVLDPILPSVLSTKVEKPATKKCEVKLERLPKKLLFHHYWLAPTSQKFKLLNNFQIPKMASKYLKVILLYYLLFILQW